MIFDIPMNNDLNMSIDFYINIDIPPPPSHPNAMLPPAPFAGSPGMGWGWGGVISIFIFISIRTLIFTSLLIGTIFCWWGNHFQVLEVSERTWLCLFLEIPNRQGTHLHSERLSNFAPSSHLDPFGDQNDVQDLLIYCVHSIYIYVYMCDIVPIWPDRQ